MSNDQFVFSTFSDADKKVKETDSAGLEKIKVKNTVLRSLLDLSFTGKLLVMGNAQKFQITIDQRYVFKVTHTLKDNHAFYRISMQNVSDFSAQQAMLLAQVGKALINDEHDAKKPFYLEANQPWQLKMLWKTLKKLTLNMLPMENDQTTQFALWEQEIRDHQSISDTFGVETKETLGAQKNNSFRPSSVHDDIRWGATVSLLFVEKLTDKVFEFFELGEEFEIESLEERWNLVVDGVPIEIVKLDNNFLQFSGLGEISDKQIGAKEKLTKLLNLIKGFDRQSGNKNKLGGFLNANRAEASTETPEASL